MTKFCPTNRKERNTAESYKILWTTATANTSKISMAHTGTWMMAILQSTWEGASSSDWRSICRATRRRTKGTIALTRWWPSRKWWWGFKCTSLLKSDTLSPPIESSAERGQGKPVDSKDRPTRENKQDQKLTSFASTCSGKTTSSCLARWYDFI